MDYLERKNVFLCHQKVNNGFVSDYNEPETKSRIVSNMQSRILEIEKAEQAERTAQNQRAERMCVAQTTHEHTVMRRLGLCIQQDTLPSPRPPTSPPSGRQSSGRPARIRRSLYVTPLHVEEERRYSGYSIKYELDVDDPFFQMKLRLANKIESLAETLARLQEQNKKPGPDSSIRSVDAYGCRKPSPESPIRSVDAYGCRKPSPDSSIRSVDAYGSRKPSPDPIPFTPPPPTPPRRKGSRIPVKFFAGPSRRVAGCMLPAPSVRVQEFIELVEQLQPFPHPPARTSAPPRKMAPVPRPPSKPAASQKRAPRRGTTVQPPKAEIGEVTTTKGDGLSLCFRQLGSDEWEKKIKGLKSVGALAQNHPDQLRTKLHEVCLLLAAEVKNLRSTVSCAAVDTIADLHLYLGKAMDPEAEGTGRALLLKLAQTSNAFIHQRVNLALDALVEGCTPARVISTLINTGLNNLNSAVRGSTAQHLHQLGNIVGEENILTAGRSFVERFLSAVSKLSLDGAPEVRLHGQRMLQGLAQLDGFMEPWSKLVPEKERIPLSKILKRMKL